ncbi:MAG: hypothetical protein HY776_06570, partial [Actinobacteria bacterium]|nr:hypothetical protein [Actinomycetota bacterium]
MKTISQEEKSQKQVQSKSNKARPNRLAVKLCICILVPMLLLLAGPTAAVAHQFDWTWGSYGQDNGQFRYPGGIAVDGNGYVYIADTHNHRVQKFTSDGAYIATWGVEGTDAGRFRYPQGVAVDLAGNVYVADKVNNRIQKLEINPDGTTVDRIIQWGGLGMHAGQFHSPRGIAVDGVGNVYVADTWNG